MRNIDFIIRTHFQRLADLFAITVGGRKIYVLTSPTDIGAVYRNNTTLSWDAMLNELLVAFGVKADNIEKVWAQPEPGMNDEISKQNPDLTTTMSTCHFILQLYKKQLLPGPRFDVFNAALLDQIDQRMRIEHVQTRFGSDLKCVSLTEFCGDVLVDAITEALFGEGIFEIETNMIKYLLEFNEEAWKLVFQVPQPKDGKLNVSRGKLLQAFTTYSIKTTGEGSVAKQSWLIKTALMRLRTLSLDDEACAGMLLMIYWAANINPYRLAFWMLTYIIFDPSLQAKLHAETKPALAQSSLNMAFVMQFCPLLDSVYNETLRLVNGALSARKIVAPTPMGGKILSEGNTLLIPFRQLHYNVDVWGPEPEKFESDRFLKKGDLLHSSSFKPFGGGVNYCPGRFLAKQEMLAFVVLALHRFDLKLATNNDVPPRGPCMIPRPQRFPCLDTKTPALGVNGPARGSDVYIDFE